jgi:hypothetical protein
MLSDAERRLLALIDEAELKRHLTAITAGERLSGGAGEARAADYVRTVLGQAGIEAAVHHSPVILSNPSSCRLEYDGAAGARTVSAKARSFAASTGGEPVAGRLAYIPAAALPAHLLEHQLFPPANRDLAGRIVLSEAGGPAAVMACARRGAVGFIHWCPGNTDLIHEGIVNPVWGTPQPGEDALYPSIPVAAVSGPGGRELQDAATGAAAIRLAVGAAETAAAIPAVEAVINPEGASGRYLLIGSHLDSWHAGVTDNGTGNALALVLAKILHASRGNLRHGVRILWWSGHSNGRYAGSAAYARDRFADLAENCLAYMNIDMPGLRGATDYSRLACGPDLYRLAQAAAADTTGAAGGLCGPVRGWDQSFQNIGISPYFVWASLHSPGHPDATSSGNMPWWWHTERDVAEYCDHAVLARDARLYALAAWRLLTGEALPFDVTALLAFARQAVDGKEETYRDVTDFAACRAELDRVAKAYRERLTVGPLAADQELFLVRRLNQLLYVEKGSHLQDWAMEQGFLPGLDAARWLRRGDLGPRQAAILRHYLACQANRLADLCDTMKMVLKG